MQAVVAVYPLGQEGFTAVERALEALRSVEGVTVTVRAMNSELEGEDAAVFEALRRAWAAAADGAAVMTITLSNACPKPGRATEVLPPR
jgi:uncharacterized protein YqgV (UPF0045/DUF77 family)